MFIVVSNIRSLLMECLLNLKVRREEKNMKKAIVKVLDTRKEGKKENCNYTYAFF